MFIEVFQAICKVLTDLWNIVLALFIADQDAKNKKTDPVNYYETGYFQPELYNANQSFTSHFRQRGVPVDVDRSTNQVSQSSAVTLPRPFYPALRQMQSPLNVLTHRAAHQQDQQHQNEMQHVNVQEALVQLGLQKSAPKESFDHNTSEQELLPSSSFVEIDVCSAPSSQLDSQQVASYGGSGGNSDNTYTSSHPLSALSGFIQPFIAPPIAPALPGLENAGLRGSRPLVKLDRLSMIAKMRREGKDGENMGNYAPER
jgi:hypothetical protein